MYVLWVVPYLSTAFNMGAQCIFFWGGGAEEPKSEFLTASVIVLAGRWTKLPMYVLWVIPYVSTALSNVCTVHFRGGGVRNTKYQSS